MFPNDAIGGRILVLSAFDPELVPLRAAQEKAKISASTLLCAAAGIGAVDAAVGAARAINAYQPTCVLFIGTAGSYGATPPLGGVVIARRVRLGSTAVVRGDGYLPAPLITSTDTDAGLRRALLKGAPPATTFVADVATPLAITKRAIMGARLAKATGAVVENLEAFAVARAAALLDVPFGAVLGISNHVGPRAHTEWIRHRERATWAASEVIDTFLARLLSPERVLAWWSQFLAQKPSPTRARSRARVIKAPSQSAASRRPSRRT